MIKYLLITTTLLVFACKTSPEERSTVLPKPELNWQSLFNGEDLTGWTPKIKGQEMGMDSLNTFRVEDGILEVSYDRYSAFNNTFGHLYYEKPFGAYFLEVEYRFLEEQAPGGEGWAYKNSGVMFHSQSPESVLLNQSFPVSLEGQLLGGNGKEERPTMNLCTPGTHVVMADSLFTPHCINSNSKTFHGQEWVKAGFLVLKDSLIVHYVNGKEVLRYAKPQLGGDMAEDASPEFHREGTPLTGGYISLQSESHPLGFKRADLLNLEPVYEDKDRLAEMITMLKQEGYIKE